MKRTLFVLLLIAFFSFVGAQPGYAQNAVAQVASNNAGAGGACAPLTVNREGIAELVCDVFAAEDGLVDSLAAGNVIVITYTTNLDLTSPVLADGATIPAANLAGTGITLTSAVFNRVVTVFPVTTTIKITLTIATATTGTFTDKIGVRNLRFNFGDLGGASATFTAAVTKGGVALSSSPVSVATTINTGSGSLGTGFGTQGSGAGLGNQASLSIAENFSPALRAARAASTTTSDIATTATQVNFNVTSIPSGVTVTFPGTFTASPGSGTPPRFQLTSATTPLTATGGSLAVTYNTTQESTAAAERTSQWQTKAVADGNRIVVTVGTSSGFGTASIQVSFGPDSTSTAVPRYAGSANTPSGVTALGRAFIPTSDFFNIASVQTNILMPWTFNTFGFESAFALSNTGLDDLDVGGASLATGQSGVIRCTVFANDGTTASVTTSATGPGRGLNADGTLSPGGTWAVSLTELLTAAGVTTAKEGYLVCQAQFQFANAAGFSIDPSGGFFTTPVVVLRTDFRSSPESFLQQFPSE